MPEGSHGADPDGNNGHGPQLVMFFSARTKSGSTLLLYVLSTF